MTIHKAIPHYYHAIKTNAETKETKSPFTCPVCLKKRKYKEYAGKIGGKPICIYCIPFADTQTVSYQINFDERYR